VFNDAYTFLVEAVGRDPNLTGRTDIWNDVLHLDVNPLLGTGFESFWLGARAEYFWQKYPFHPNQAHNGYIDTYLNLGYIGLGLLIILMFAGLLNIADAFKRNLPFATLKLSFLLIAAVYNITEGAFKVMQPVYIAFLFSVVAVPAFASAKNKARHGPDNLKVSTHRNATEDAFDLVPRPISLAGTRSADGWAGH
jgi:exopolysaccharide production protein ExoQ